MELTKNATKKRGKHGIRIAVSTISLSKHIHMHQFIVGGDRRPIDMSMQCLQHCNLLPHIYVIFYWIAMLGRHSSSLFFTTNNNNIMQMNYPIFNRCNQYSNRCDAVVIMFHLILFQLAIKNYTLLYEMVERFPLFFDCDWIRIYGRCVCVCSFCYIKTSPNYSFKE